MTLQQLFDAIYRIAVNVASFINPIAYIQARISQTATENHPGQINANVIELVAIATDGTVGNLALHNQITALSALVTALGSPQQAGSPVTLPAPAPSGYGGGASASDVWASPTTVGADSAGDLLNWAAIAGAAIAGGYVDQPFTAGLVKVSNFLPNLGHPEVVILHYPVFDETNILSTELDPLTCVARQNPDWTCFYPWTGSTQVGLSFTGSSETTWVTTFDQAGFDVLRARLYPPAASTGAPVWPGLANVTLGTPVALAVGVTVTTPMDGVIVEVTSVPAGTSFFTFDDVESYRYIGAIAFVDDDGHEEFPQNLGFASALYCPRSMAVAAAVKVRTKPGIVGTVTPWVRT